MKNESEDTMNFDILPLLKILLQPRDTSNRCIRKTTARITIFV